MQKTVIPDVSVPSVLFPGNLLTSAVTTLVMAVRSHAAVKNKMVTLHADIFSGEGSDKLVSKNISDRLSILRKLGWGYLCSPVEPARPLCLVSDLCTLKPHTEGPQPSVCMSVGWVESGAHLDCLLCTITACKFLCGFG